MRGRGVEFEDYDTQDSEGNLLGIVGALTG
jgi:hypothetical protein